MISKDYILGLVEGEGCFSILFQKYIDRKPRKLNRRSKIKNPYLIRVSPTFRITLNTDDSAVFDEIKQTLGVGAINIQRRSQTNDNERDVAYFYVDGVDGCSKVENFFKDLNFRTTKGESFKKWGECLELMRQKKHLTKEGILEICDLRDGMNFRKVKCKWTREEIEKVFEANPIHQTAHFHPEQQNLIHNNSFDLNSFLEKKPGNNKQSLSTTAQNRSDA